MKTHWVSVYKCKWCGTEIEGADRYNDYGKTQFPNVDAPREIAHQCTLDCTGRAVFVGLRKKDNSRNQGQLPRKGNHE